ncbi:MAG: NYN domain-containing protein [Bauldia sp.]
MADAIKSVLFVDYDSLDQALRGADPAAAERLASRVVAWVAAIEQGRLAPSADASLRRRVLMRRCYANPALLGDKRKHFTGNGFLVVDCPPLEGFERSAADIQMALDTIDALGHPTAYDEFILLSADRDLSPVLIRVRAHNRQTVIYATPETADAYRAIADGAVDQEPFVALLTAADEPKVVEPAVARQSSATAAPGAATPPADRTEIEALARKVHGATSVPLFSPKSYLELFRVLAAEIAENGYHFQSTAENVAAKLTAGGRNATRRQIVFIVKGLALKGHVFSNTDTPDKLADVFREQVLYLARNAGIELTPREIAIMPSWIIGRIGSTAAAVAAEIDSDMSEPEPLPPPKVAPVAARPPETRPPPPRPADDQGRAGKKKPGKPGQPGKSETTITPTPPRPAVFGAAKNPEAAKPAPAPARAGVFPRPLSPPPARPSPFAAKTPASAPTGGVARTTTPLLSTSSRPALITPKPLAPRPFAEKPPEKPAPAAPAVESAAPDKAAGDKSAVESTILAAIAQAVDVLVEDSGAAKAMEKDSERASGDAPATPQAEDVPPPSPDSDDIGDEIQRIIASYNRDRQQSD